MLLCCAHKKTCSIPCALDSLSLMLVPWNDAQTELGFSCMHTACVWLYTVSKVLPCSLKAPGGLGAGFTTTDLPAPLQGKIGHQAAAALCPAVWRLCQGFLHRCIGVHQAEEVGWSLWAILSAVTRFPKRLDVICQSPHQRSLSSPPSEAHFHACCDQMAVVLPWILPQARANTRFF